MMFLHRVGCISPTETPLGRYNYYIPSIPITNGNEAQSEEAINTNYQDDSESLTYVLQTIFIVTCSVSSFVQLVNMLRKIEDRCKNTILKLKFCNSHKQPFQSGEGDYQIISMQYIVLYILPLTKRKLRILPKSNSKYKLFLNVNSRFFLFYY